MRNPRIWLCGAILGASALSIAQDFTLTYFRSLESQRSAIVTTKRLTTFTNVLGKGISLDLDGFVGAYFDGNPVAGFALSKRFKIADQADWYVGFGATVQDQRPMEWGPLIGVQVRF